MADQLDRHELFHLLSQRNDEIASLKAINKQTQEKLRVAEANALKVTNEARAVEDRLAELRVVATQSIEAGEAMQDEIKRATEANAALSRQVSQLQQLLEEHVVLRRGQYPYVGLCCGSTGGGSGVQVASVRDPAAAAGVAVGDVIREITVSKVYPISSMSDFEQFVVELPPESRVTIRTSTREISSVIPKLLRAVPQH